MTTTRGSHALGNATKEDSRGQRIVKQGRGQKIDLAVSAGMAHDVAGWVDVPPVRGEVVFLE